MKEKFINYLTTSPEEKPEDHAAICRNTDKDTRDYIDDIQTDKQEIVDKMKDWRRKFTASPEDNPTEDLESLLGNHTLQKTESGYRTHLRGAVPIELTEGEVFASYQWGTFWKFDESVSQHDQQKIMMHQVRNLVSMGFDDQLVALGQVNRLSDDIKRDAYENIANRSLELHGLPDGVLAEKFILSFLHKAQRDLGLPFTIQEVDIYEDVENKVDFIVSVHNHRRGVHVEEDQKNIGVQFTLKSKAKDIRNKKRQIERSKAIGDAEIDDLVLVSLPQATIREPFNQWRYRKDGTRKNEKQLDPRGPDHLLSDQMKIDILKAIFKSIPLGISKEELHKLFPSDTSPARAA